jgi:hypothetical protein
MASKGRRREPSGCGGSRIRGRRVAQDYTLNPRRMGSKGNALRPVAGQLSPHAGHSKSCLYPEDECSCSCPND